MKKLLLLVGLTVSALFAACSGTDTDPVVVDGKGRITVSANFEGYDIVSSRAPQNPANSKLTIILTGPAGPDSQTKEMAYPAGGVISELEPGDYTVKATTHKTGMPGTGLGETYAFYEGVSGTVKVEGGKDAAAAIRCKLQNGGVFFNFVDLDEIDVLPTVTDATSVELAFSSKTDDVGYFNPGQNVVITATIDGKPATIGGELSRTAAITANKLWKVTFRGVTPEPEKGNINLSVDFEEIDIDDTTHDYAVVIEEDITFGLKKVWSQRPNTFDDLHFGNADEAGAQDLAPSNTFLVRPGQKYRFKANVMGRGGHGVAALGLPGSDPTLGGFNMKADGTIHPDLTGDYEYIYFTTPSDGDAAAGTVGVMSLTINGKVAWSWTIWSRDEDPGDETIGTHNCMSLPVGSYGPHQIPIRLGHSTTDQPFIYFYGLPYSWGMPIPQPGVSSQNKAIMVTTKNIESKLSWTYLYDGEGNAVLATTRPEGAVSANLDEAISNPLRLAALVSAGGTDEYINMWGHVSGEKTIFDPCPYGYKVVSSEVFEGMTFGLFGKGGIKYESSFEIARYLLWGGLLTMDRDANKPSYTEVDASGYYWTSQPSEGQTIADPDAVKDKAHSKVFRVNDTAEDAMTSTTLRENGALIRCIRYSGEV